VLTGVIIVNSSKLHHLKFYKRRIHKAVDIPCSNQESLNPRNYTLAFAVREAGPLIHSNTLHIRNGKDVAMEEFNYQTVCAE